MLALARLVCALLALGSALALTLTSPGRDAQWRKGARETIAWTVRHGHASYS